jgi:hypothetical protein
MSNKRNAHIVAIALISSEAIRAKYEQRIILTGTQKTHWLARASPVLIVGLRTYRRSRTMTTRNFTSSDFSGSAKIYTFPPRGRFALSNGREEPEPATNRPSARGVKLASSSGWYHEAAIQAEKNRNQ